MPADEERHRESVVLLEIIAASRLNPAFAPVVRQMASNLHQVLAEAITTMGAADPAREAVRLAALISGLSLKAVTPHGSVEPATIRAVLEAHVAEL
ncbi:TetR family transcriptional regulator C-terminal domain-containing protein [Nocardia sputi]|uniref:TetR family transcriptional regulator C-terminal domain-containing protein n=1 Tax=Nocardia sputi TaxID=2943705 RepID=UPI0020BFB723|nr:TetR family transcriptional regulator C-terminal domain-containing protein [Nocardia sputi]